MISWVLGVILGLGFLIFICLHGVEPN